MALLSAHVNGLQSIMGSASNAAIHLSRLRLVHVLSCCCLRPGDGERSKDRASTLRMPCEALYCS
jgi:hypothetical protein